MASTTSPPRSIPRSDALSFPLAHPSSSEPQTPPPSQPIPIKNCRPFSPGLEAGSSSADSSTRWELATSRMYERIAAARGLSSFEQQHPMTTMQDVNEDHQDQGHRHQDQEELLPSMVEELVDHGVFDFEFDDM